jgi:hypothetical protein
LSRLNIFPPVAVVYPNDRQKFRAQAAPPPAMWASVSDSGDIKSDFSLEVDPAGSTTSGAGAHFLASGIGIVELTVDDQSRPTSTGQLVINGFINDIAGFQYFYSIKINATNLEVRDEANVQIYSEPYSTVSGDVYRMELAAGFRLYRNGVLKHSRVNLGTTVVYPMTYQLAILEPTATAPTRIPQPRLIGDWQLGGHVIWTTPEHGQLTTLGPAIECEYFNGQQPGTYTLQGQISSASDGFLIQRATAKIIIPPFQALGDTDLVLQPGAKIRPKTNYDEAQTALVAWALLLGPGAMTQGEYTAGDAPGRAIIRATVSVNGLSASIQITVPAVITNPNGYTAAKSGEVIDFDTNIPAIPYFISAGSVGVGTAGTTPGVPPLFEQGDIFLLFVESANEVVAAPSGWTAVADSPQGTGTAGGTAATRLSVFWKRAALTESPPSVADPGDHVVAQILAFRACISSGNPWDVTAGDVAAATTTAVAIPGDTTTVPNCLVVLAVANATDTDTPQTSGYTNPDLANLAERADFNNSQGNGGGFAVITGEKAVAGAYGATTATLATASVQGRMSVALKPGVHAWSASVGSMNGATGQWTAPSLPGQTARITVTNGTTTVTQEIDVLEAFPRTDFKLPWQIDLVKRVLVSEAEDGGRTSRVKGRARRSFPVELLVDAVEDLNGAGLSTIRDFWDRHHPGVRFILEDPEEGFRLVVYSDSDLRWEHTGVGINIAFRVKEA